ncbi:MAG: peptidylprolyl isomerase [Paludibacteraceae bacterium]|nr:peptidylprolyl isomerase [Paludibacteraceae bacterium]
MKRIFYISALALLMAVPTFAQNDKVLLTIDDEPVMVSEFLYIYNKNNAETNVEQKTLQEYLDLFVNFKLKVKEAEDRGLDTVESFTKELASYRRQAIPRYMQDSVAEDEMIRLTYNHISRDRRAAHIAIECPMNANDSLEADALQRIQLARKRVTEGIPVKKGKKTIQGKPEDFFAVAREMSTDPSVGDNNGELGWIVPLRYVWPFEKAVYETPVGSVTEVFRTQYGFHIALVEEERAHEEVNARHIMKMVPRDSVELDRAAKQQIDSIYQTLISGADFAESARLLSDDKGSAMRGGELGWFARGMMVKPFEDAAFALDSGAISKPFRSRYGWHIVQNLGRKGIDNYEARYKDLKQKVRRDERYREVEKAFVEKIRKEYGLSDTVPDAEVLATENANLENKYIELRNLMKEYHDGILLFDISLSEVWDKAAVDTVGLTAFFKQHKKEYTWDKPHFKGRVVYCKDKNSMKAAKAILRSANKDSIDSYIKNRVNIDSIVYVRTERGLWAQGEHKAVDKLQWKLGEWNPSEEYPYVFLSGKVLKNPEEYSDERNAVVTAYQDYLEKKWIDELKKKHIVVLNHEALKELGIE